MQCCLRNIYKRITNKIDFSNISKQFVTKSEDIIKNYRKNTSKTQSKHYEANHQSHSESLGPHSFNKLPRDFGISICGGEKHHAMDVVFSVSVSLSHSLALK